MTNTNTMLNENMNETIIAEKPRYIAGTNMIHQSVIALVDTSGSMSGDKIRIVQEQLNSMQFIDLSPSEKEAVDFCAIGFDDEPYLIQEWIPLSDFHGGITLKAEGCTNIPAALENAIAANKLIREEGNKYGIEFRRTQIFMFTDGESTHDMTAITARCNDYFDREHPSARLNVTLIPPANDPSEIQKLGNNVAIFHVDDLVNGIPGAFKFMKDSVVQLSQSQPGETVVTKFSNLSFIDGQGGVSKDPEGGGKVKQTVWTK